MPPIITEAPSRRRPPPRHLWIIGGLALLWNAVGAFDYLATQLQLEFYMGQFTEEQLAYFYGFPAWVTAAWAIAVWSAVGGSVGLLLRRRWALWLFIASLAGMLVTTVHTLILTEGIAIMGAGGAIFSMLIVAIGIGLIVYAGAMAGRRVLR